MNIETTQTHFIKGILFFIYLLSYQSFSQTFDWETAVDNGDNATQTVSGVTATVTTNIITTITDNISVFNFFNNGSGTSGLSVSNTLSNHSNSLTVSFSSPIDIATIFVFDAARVVGNNWTLTPVGGSNTSITQLIQDNFGSTITTNWTNVTSFTITSAQGDDTFGIDDIVFTSTLSIDDNNFNSGVTIYPNPTSEYLNILGLKEETSYAIFNILGQSVLNGNTSEENSINIKMLSKGTYFISLGNYETLKFIKKNEN